MLYSLDAIQMTSLCHLTRVKGHILKEIILKGKMIVYQGTAILRENSGQRVTWILIIQSSQKDVKGLCKTVLMMIITGLSTSSLSLVHQSLLTEKIYPKSKSKKSLCNALVLSLAPWTKQTNWRKGNPTQSTNMITKIMHKTV